MKSYTNARLNDLALNQQFAKKYFREIVTILVSADEELSKKYLPGSEVNLYKSEPDMTSKDIGLILSIPEAQLSLVTSQLKIYSLIQTYDYEERATRATGKEAGRHLYGIEIVKENNDIFAKEMFDKHFKNYLTSITCQQALEKAKLFFSEKLE